MPIVPLATLQLNCWCLLPMTLEPVWCSQVRAQAAPVWSRAGSGRGGDAGAGAGGPGAGEKVYLSRATLVVVPAVLIGHWQQQVEVR